MLPLAYIVMYNEIFESYIQAFQQLKRLFEDYDIDNYNILIYDRDRAAINAIIAVFLGIDTMLYIQYIDTAVKAYIAKTFGQQKNYETNRFEPSELANEFLALYRNCRYVPTEEAFDQACANLDERTRYGEIQQYNSDSEVDKTQRDIEIEEELDNIARLLSNPTAATTFVKDTLERQQKIVRYLQTVQQVYKEKYVKAQTDRLRYFGYDILSSSKSAYKSLKVQLATSRNDILIFFIKLALFYDGHLDREKAKLSYTQNTTLIAFVYREYYYKVNTVVGTRALYYIQKQKQKLDRKLE